MASPFARLFDRPRLGTGAGLKGLTWLFCLLLIVVAWAAILQRIRFERDQAVDEAVAQNINRVMAFEQYVRRTLEVAAIATRYVAERFERGDAGAEFVGTPDRPAIMQGNLARTGTFLGIAIVNANGDIIARSRPGGGRLNVAGDQAFQVHVARDSGRLFVGRPVRLPMVGRDVILLTRRLNNPDGSFAGVVALSIAPEQFIAFYRDAHMGPQDVLSLIGLDGVTRARRTGDAASWGEDVRGTLVMRMQMQNPNGTYLGPSVLDGTVRFFSHRRLADYQLFATYGVPEEQVLASAGRRARLMLVAVSLITLAILAFATMLTLLINRGERRATEMALANRRLQDAQRIGEIGDWRYGLEDDPLYWSPQIYKLYERDPALGPLPTAEFRALLDDDGRSAIDAGMARAVASGDTQQVEFKVHLPSGAEVHHQVVVMPIHDDSGRTVGVHGTTQNVTGRKLIERLETRVAQLSRIDAMNAMAATLAHELNQPLAAAVNYLAGCRLHLDGAPNDMDGLREGLRGAENQIHFVGEIIRRVREMVGNQPRMLTSFSLAPVIDDALALIATAQDEPKPKVAKHFAPDARRVRADRVQVQQVMINLLRNALDATRGVERPDIEISSARGETSMIQVEITDNGPGFDQPPDERFSPFTAKGSGMGLGLSISRTIVELHGGRIWTEDRPGCGATVIFTLPAAGERPAHSPAKAESEPA
jgi:signal transduction histidine kinase